MERQDNNESNEEGITKEDEQTLIEQKVRAKWEALRPSYESWERSSSDSLGPFDQIIEGQIELARVTYQKDRAEEELEDSHELWDRISAEETEALKALLDTNPKEGELHQFLDENPKFLVQVLSGGHGRYQLSKKKLGAEFVPDFLVAEMSSIGIEWHSVEIESPRVNMYRKDGQPTQELNHAIGQIRDWRDWLRNNIDYARRDPGQQGLGLIGIDDRVPGLILIGRRANYPARFNEYRKQLTDRERIVIHSYDWLVDAAESNRSGWLRVTLSQ